MSGCAPRRLSRVKPSTGPMALGSLAPEPVCATAGVPDVEVVAPTEGEHSPASSLRSHGYHRKRHKPSSSKATTQNTNRESRARCQVLLAICAPRLPFHMVEQSRSGNEEINRFVSSRLHYQEQWQASFLKVLWICRRSTWLCIDMHGQRTSLHSDKRGIIQVWPTCSKCVSVCLRLSPGTRAKCSDKPSSI